MGRAIIAVVKGGLGNQLFIYATARAFALRTGRTLYLDNRRGYTNDTYGRSYRLNRLPIKAGVMPESWRVAPTLKHPRHKILRFMSKFLPRDQRTYIAEDRHLPTVQLTALESRRARITLLGYWQNEEYFADYADLVRHELTPPAPVDDRNRELALEMEKGESVFLHVRRVRYTPILSSAYYQAAIDAVRRDRKNVRFYLLGDDLAWPRVNLNFGDSEVRVIDHNSADEFTDLWLMTRCRHAIVANSSFSWWGAWLGDGRPERRVFAPEAPGLPLVMPGRWTQIPDNK